LRSFNRQILSESIAYVIDVKSLTPPREFHLNEAIGTLVSTENKRNPPPPGAIRFGIAFAFVAG
jgi:hypothetical protein